jgi:dipeptidyl aminopeptidase/acylaminoacyl peptidase
MDVFSLEWASDPEISPDGAQVAYVRRSFDVKTDKRRGAIWLVGRDGNDHRPLEGSEASQSSPRWSPDGARLAFVATDANGAQIPHALVQGKCHGARDEPARCADRTRLVAHGSQLAFVMRVPAKREPLKVKLPEAPKDANWAEPLKASTGWSTAPTAKATCPTHSARCLSCPAEGGAPRQLTDGPFDHDDVAWSRDGNEILVSANRHENRITSRMTARSTRSTSRRRDPRADEALRAGSGSPRRPRTASTSPSPATTTPTRATSARACTPEARRAAKCASLRPTSTATS